jgi:hypothetical protein
MIKLSMNKKVKVLKKVRIKDNCWNMPGGGYLNPDSIVQIVSGPTRISDVPFEVIKGCGEIIHRHIAGETTRLIKPGSKGFFFSQGHKTVAPYDYGSLDPEFFEELK